MKGKKAEERVAKSLRRAVSSLTYGVRSDDFRDIPRNYRYDSLDLIYLGINKFITSTASRWKKLKC